ncbi:MAG: hypothetical protein AAGD35_14705 [Actinomycetota bacterium]
MSRDGVPLCPHHADATTPPMGWTMNDLRSQNRALAPVRELGPSTGEVVTNPTRRGRKAPAERARPERPERTAATPERAASGRTTPAADTEPEPSQESLSFPVSRGLDSMTVSARAGDEEADVVDAADERAAARARRRAAAENSGPASRPSKRREVDPEPEAGAEAEEEEKFSWTFKFDDDEEQPEELQAKSPLLSRAFRSSVG